MSEEVWKATAKHIGAHYTYADGLPSVTVRARGGQIRLKHEYREHSNRRTKVTYAAAAYEFCDDFKFSVRLHEFSDDIVQFFGGRDVEVGHPDFDSRFVITSNDEQKARALFADPAVRRYLTRYSLKRKPYLYTRETDDGLGMATVLGTRREIYWDLYRFENDAEVLITIFTELTAMLNRLCEIGSIVEDSST